MVSQLRIFTIAPGKMDDFVDAWVKGVYPLRLKHGFTIDAAWVLQDSDKFAWTLSYEGPEAWDDKDRAYYASTERHNVDPDPRRYIVKIESYFLTPVLETR